MVYYCQNCNFVCITKRDLKSHQVHCVTKITLPDVEVESSSCKVSSKKSIFNGAYKEFVLKPNDKTKTIVHLME